MIRVYVADDHPIVREGLKRLLAEHREMDLVGEASTGDEALAKLGETTSADVLLLDVSMPGPGVLEIIRRLREQQPSLRILVLSVHSEDRYAIRTLRAGASGYLMKDRTPEELAGAIRKVYRGGRYVSETLAERLALDLVDDYSERPHERLSNREYQVLTGLAVGRSSKEIAARLRVSPKTVATYRARLLEKLDLKTTADLIRYALEHDLVSDEGHRG